MKIPVTFILLLCFLSGKGQTEIDFQPFPGDSAKLYQFDLAKNFFKTKDEETAERAKLIEALRKLDTKFPKTFNDPGQLLVFFNTYDSLSRRVGKHLAYLTLAGTINLSNAEITSTISSFNSELSSLALPINKKIFDIDSAAFKDAVKRQPALKEFLFFYRGIKGTDILQLPEQKALLVNDITPQLTGWQPRLFQTTLRSTIFKPVETPKGLVTTGSNEMWNHKDRAVRKQGYQNMLEGWMAKRDVFAFALIETIRGRNKLATLRGYKDYPDQFYNGLFFTKAEVLDFLKTLSNNADINKRYEAVLVKNIQKFGKLDTVMLWDRYLPDPDIITPRFTITEASKIILNATKVLGREYEEEMSKLLNPENGRLDMVPRPDRVVRPGFSTGSVGYNSTFFQGRYEGYVADLIIFGHEAGHAVQNMLMETNRVRSVYAGGPSYFTESFAFFNELLITDYLYKTATTVSHKKYYLQKFLDQAAADLFSNTQDAVFEQSLYDSIPASRINNADQVERQMQKVGSHFSTWYSPFYKNEMQWVNKLQFVMNPFYRLNYVYSKVLALNYFDLYEKKPAEFLTGYGQLLRNGYNNEPEKLLDKFLHLSFNQNLITNALELIKKRITEYENLSK